MANFRADRQLLRTAAAGDDAGVEQALRSGAEVNVKGEHNATALNQAALQGHTTVVKRLLDAGADVENVGAASMTALMSAAAHGHFELAQLLLERNAHVSDELLATIQTKVHILQENAEGGPVKPEAAEAWKAFLDYVVTQRMRQDLPLIAPLLTDAGEEERRDATRRVAEAARRGLDVALATDGLRARLDDEEAETRKEASGALTRQLARGGDVNAVRALIESHDEPRQAGAIASLAYAARDGADIAPLMPSLVALLAHSLAEVRRNTALTLAMAGSRQVDVSSAIPRLVALLSDADAGVRRSTAITFTRLARAGVDVAAALPRLDQLTSDPDESVARMASNAVAAAGGGA